MESIQYREACVADISTLVDLRVAFLSDLFQPPPEEEVIELKTNLAIYFAKAMPDQSYRCILAEVGGKVVGVGGMAIYDLPGGFKNPSGRVGYIMNMYTLSEFRRRGICFNLVNRLTELGQSMGIISFLLHATKSGAPVYQQCGFELRADPAYSKYVV